MKKKLKLNLNKKQIFVAVIIGILVISSIIFAVVNLSKKNEDNIDNPAVEPEEEQEEPTLQIVDVNSTSRPYAVMINNLSVARPYHTGLQEAYLVYEIVVEGGITRYMALFKDKDLEVVGSVRSARHYYLDYALENDAYYVHWGWSPQAQSDIKTLDVDNISGLTYGKPYFFRQNLGISSEHTGYVNLKEMDNLVRKLNYRTKNNQGLLLKYSATNIDMNAFEDKIEAKNIDLKYSAGFTTNYVYDSSANVYKQYVNDREHTDYETKQQYTVKNIITYQVVNHTISGDNKGRQTLDNIGSGTGYFITEGYAVPITWEKSSRSSKTVYRYLDGTEITVNDGNTWIHIVPKTGSINIS